MNAQDSIFSLKSYIPPNFKYSELRINPYIEQNYTSAVDLKRTNLRFNPSIFYRHSLLNEKNTRAIQANVFPRYNYDKLNDIRPPNQNGRRFSFNFDFENDFYFKEYWHLISNTFLDFTTNKSIHEDRTNNVFNSISIGIGYGRPQDILGAWKAIVLMDDLEKAGIPITKSNLKGLADQIYKLRQRRFKDFRLGNIQQLSNLYTYLLDNHIHELTPLNAAIIQDSYTYEGNRQRKNGYKVSLQLNPTILSTYSQTLNSSENSFSLLAKVSTFEPINKFLQFNNVGLISYGYHYSSETIFGFDRLSHKRIELSWTSSLGWYPSARTILYTQIRSTYRKNTFQNDNKPEAYILELNTNFEYYFSRNLIAEFNFFMNFNSPEFFKNSINVNQGLSLSFNFILI